MKLQIALSESTPDGFQDRPSLSLTPAMDEDIVRIAFELDARKCPLHPEFERVVQEEIGQQRTDDAALRRPCGPLILRAVWTLHDRRP